MSTSYQQTLVKRLTEERLESYLTATGGEVAASIRLYDWNAFAGASLLADLGRLEVLFRNAVDQSLRDYGDSRGWPEPWHRRRALFEGRSRAREWSDIEKAERDHAEMLAVIGWICKDCNIWAKTASRTTAILATRP